jgi:hypothetical protein
VFPKSCISCDRNVFNLFIVTQFELKVYQNDYFQKIIFTEKLPTAFCKKIFSFVRVTQINKKLELSITSVSEVMAPRKKVFCREVAILIAPTVVFEEEKYKYTGSGSLGHWVRHWARDWPRLCLVFLVCRPNIISNFT